MSVMLLCSTKWHKNQWSVVFRINVQSSIRW